MTEITFNGSEFASLKDNVIIVTGKCNTPPTEQHHLTQSQVDPLALASPT
jgi:hypothetical protein